MDRTTVATVRARLPDRGTAAVAALEGVAGSFAVAGFTPAFVAGPVAGVLSRRLPAAVVNAAILGSATPADCSTSPRR